MTESIEFLEKLAEKVFELRDGGLSPRQISNILLKDAPKSSIWLEEISDGEFSREKLIINILTKWGKD